MRWLWLILLAACTSGPRVSREGMVPCGTEQCDGNHMCVTEYADSVWGTSDAGIGDGDVIARSCVAIPSSCVDEFACDCLESTVGYCTDADPATRQVATLCY